jgi:thiol-disulfide isomerase/thioredoxin
MRIKLCDKCPTVLFMLATKSCYYCKIFQPVRDQLLSQDNVYNTALKMKIHYTRFETGEDDEIQNAFGITSYPSILVFSSNTQKFVKYDGPRTADEISSFAARYHNGTMQTPVKLWQTTPRMILN